MVRLNVANETLTLAIARSIEQACKAEGLEFPEVRTEGLWERALLEAIASRAGVANKLAADRRRIDANLPRNVGSRMRCRSCSAACFPGGKMPEGDRHRTCEQRCQSLQRHTILMAFSGSRMGLPGARSIPQPRRAVPRRGDDALAVGAERRAIHTILVPIDNQALAQIAQGSIELQFRLRDIGSCNSGRAIRQRLKGERSAVAASPSARSRPARRAGIAIAWVNCSERGVQPRRQAHRHRV